MKENVELTANLDFSNSYIGLPLGASSNWNCIPFSGKLQGNGYSIKGFKMNNTKIKGYNHAGLFCSLKDAIVENLVIEPSCSFTGYKAGALSVSVNGSLTVRHTKNYARVNGEYGVGGFIGMVQRLKQRVVISFEDCVNRGHISVNADNVGGFVGEVVNNTDITLTISNSTNYGRVYGRHNVGGFVSFGHNNTNMRMTLSDSVNNGTVDGYESCVGGFVGLLKANTDSFVTVSNFSNNGNIMRVQSNGGGIVGHVLSNTNTNITISNSINNAIVTGSNWNQGGFIGFVEGNTKNDNSSLQVYQQWQCHWCHKCWVIYWVFEGKHQFSHRCCQFYQQWYCHWEQWHCRWTFGAHLL